MAICHCRASALASTSWLGSSPPLLPPQRFCGLTRCLVHEGADRRGGKGRGPGVERGGGREEGGAGPRVNKQNGQPAKEAHGGSRRRPPATRAQREIDQWHACRELTAVKRPPARPRCGLARHPRAYKERTHTRGAVFWVASDAFGGGVWARCPPKAPQVWRGTCNRDGRGPAGG